MKHLEQINLAIAAHQRTAKAIAELSKARDCLRELCRDLGINHPALYKLADAHTSAVTAEGQLALLLERIPA